MDILRKMFKLNSDEANNKTDNSASANDQFRKPQWFEESETDDELFDDDRKFAFQIYTNPLELQKHFEQQMQQILESINEFDDSKVDKNLKDEFLKPGFEGSLLDEFKKHNKSLDTDLDGEIYADQLHSLMQRLSPEEPSVDGILPRNYKSNSLIKPKKKLSDEETILGKIHGTLGNEARSLMPRQHQRSDLLAPSIMPRGLPSYGGVFDGTYQGPKLFRQSVITKTVRKPDGSYETTKITEDTEGHKTTTVTRTIDGKSETVTTYDDKNTMSGVESGESNVPHARISDDNGVQQVYSDRNIYVTKKGYAVPRNLW